MTSAPTDNPFAGITRFRRRSEMYRWLRQHHEMLRETLAVDQPTWQAVAERMAAAGVVDSKGQAPSAENVRKTWTRVCRDVSAVPGEAKGAPVARQNPSRFARTWQPPAAPMPASDLPADPPQETGGSRTFRSFKGLGDVRAPTPSAPAKEAGSAAAAGGSTELPPAQWPKPVL